ncbi:hypothetical protein Trydic_g16788 [Trypoxylus dichotomus]
MMLLLILSSLLFRISLCLYENADVVHLNANNFDRLVTSGSDTWLVQFFSSYCPYCQNFAPNFEKAAKELKGTIKVGVVDADEDRSLLRRYNVRGIPTVKIYHPNNPVPENYDGPRTAEALVEKVHAIKKSKRNKLAKSTKAPGTHKTDETVKEDSDTSA